MSTEPRRVVVTGMGAFSPLGADVDSTWQGMLAGRSGIVALEDEQFADLPARIAGRVATEPTEVLDRVEARKLDRSAQFALIVAREAWKSAGEPDIEPERRGVVMATGIGGLTTLLTQYDNLREKGPRRVSPHTVPMLMPNGPAGTIGLELKARAGVHVPVSACASGAEAIANGYDMVRNGRADVVVAGGTEAVIHPLPLAAFANMMALSKRNDEPQRASRPFDKARDGFVMGEGSAAVVLETLESAQRRGATIYAEVLGYGMSNDAHHIAQPEPEGNGIRRAIGAVLTNAGIEPADVRHINAHATSTPLGDIAEAIAIRATLGDEATDNLVVTAPKSLFGHLLGAAGAIESMSTVLALHHRVVPPTINLDDPDDEVPLDIATEPRELPGGDLVAFNNAFGFGGANVVVAFGTYA
ncbi:MAG: beta-ketoacyl-ACP synthase II [Streptosporangiales bacterium]|nr:beta-ketoacyl-ACP synthase II [Streptosporangiales bacterium]